MGILLAVANRKGGVGKSTVTTMLAHGFAAIGEQRVLVVDLDTQCNSSIILTGGEKWDTARRNRKTIAEYFDQKYDRPKLRPDGFIIDKAGDIEIPVGSLSVLSGSLDLEDVENAFLHNRAKAGQDFETAEQGVISRIHDMLKDFANSFDVVIFDCPPGLSFSTRAALRLAHKVIVPFRPDFVSSYAADRAATVIEDKRRLEDVIAIPKEKRRYITLVNFWRDGTFQRLNYANVAAIHPVMRTTIPQDDGIAEAFEYRGEMLSIEEKYGSGAEVVRALCKEAVELNHNALPKRGGCMNDERQTKILAALRDLFDAIAEEVRTNPSFAGKVQASLAVAAGLSGNAGAPGPGLLRLATAGPAAPVPGTPSSGLSPGVMNVLRKLSRACRAAAPARSIGRPSSKRRQQGQQDAAQYLLRRA